MSNISRDDVISHFGALDDVTVAEVIGTGITLDQMAVARDIVASDENRAHRGERLPPGATGRVIEIVERVRRARRHPTTGSMLGEGGSGMT